ALKQVLDQPALGRISDPELDDVVREQRRDEPGEKEREPDRGPCNHRCLAEEGEDAGPDHGADAEERGAAYAHARSGVTRAQVADGRTRDRTSGSAGTRPRMLPSGSRRARRETRVRSGADAARHEHQQRTLIKG